MIKNINPAKDSESRVSTIISTTLIKRENCNSPITETDLENYLVESVWKVFDKSRLKIASKLDISEFDLALKNAQTFGFRIDGHKVLNPEGFTGKTIEISTLVTICRKWIDFLESNVLEEGSVHAYIIGERSKKANVLYAKISDSNTEIFAVTPRKTSLIGRLEFGRLNVLNSIADFFSADIRTADLIYKRLIAHDASPDTLKRLEKIFTDSFKDLVNGIYDIATSAKDLDISAVSDIFMNTFILPEGAYEKSFMFMDKRVKIKNANDANRDLSMFFEEKSRHYKSYNDVIRTRIKWLRI